MKSLLFLSIIPLLVIATVTNAYAGGARSDWSDKYDSIPGAPECWQDGYDDGLDRPFNRDRYNDCDTAVGNPYMDAFMHGCRHAGNTEETCEKFTD